MNVTRAFFNFFVNKCLNVDIPTQLVYKNKLAYICETCNLTANLKVKMFKMRLG